MPKRDAKGRFVKSRKTKKRTRRRKRK